MNNVIDDEPTEAETEALGEVAAALLSVLVEGFNREPQPHLHHMAIAATLAVRALAAKVRDRNPALAAEFIDMVLRVSFDMAMGVDEAIIAGVEFGAAIDDDAPVRRDMPARH